MADLPGYTFVPWFRRGLATGIADPDVPTDPAKGRTKVSASLSVGWSDTAAHDGTPLQVTQSLQLVGPGDVERLTDGAVLRCHPPDGAREATPGELAYVEFYDEDLPWRYTPAAPVTGTVATPAGPVTGPRLRPWLALLVLSGDEGTVTQPASGLPVLAVADAVELPDLTQGWAFGHSQLAGNVADPAAAGPAVEHDPDTALSRLLCPRRLVPDTAYTAYLVPAFETGRLAGLELDPSTAPARQPAWTSGQKNRRLPVYFSWRFSTGDDSGFEVLVRRLKARPVGDGFGSRSVAVDGVALGLTELPASVRFEGALQPPEYDVHRTQYPTVPGAAAVTALQGRVDASGTLLDPEAELDDDPIVSPPLYAGRHAGIAALSDVEDDDPLGWVRELNLDPRERAAAGLGASVVRDRQEDLMVRAWAQVGHLRDANQRLREATLAVEAASSAFVKHLSIEPTGRSGVDAARLLLLTAPAHGGIGLPRPANVLATTPVPVPSVRATVAASRVPTSAVSEPAFRRVTRPARPLLRESVGTVQAFQAGLVDRMDEPPAHALSSAQPVPVAPISVTLDAVDAVAAAAAAGITAREAEPPRVLLSVLADLLSPVSGTPPAIPADPAALSLALQPLLTQWAQQHAGHPGSITEVNTLLGLVNAIRQRDGYVAVQLPAATFRSAYGKTIAGKALRGVAVVSDAPPAGSQLSRMADPSDAASMVGGLASLRTDLTDRLDALPAPSPALGASGTVADAVVAGLEPVRAVYERVVAALPGLTDRLAVQHAVATRRLAPVMAYPTFDDPMVDPLQALSQDFVLPNIAVLPSDTITVMEPNLRFIEAYLAGMNTEMARELLWREYPTDSRGSCFRVFWDRRDAVGVADTAPPEDVAELIDWLAPLGQNRPSGALPTVPLVLVLRSDLLHRYPNTVVTAQRAAWTDAQAQGHRTLDPAGPLFTPLFTATMAPDVALFGFQLGEEEARGHVPTSTTDPVPADPGYFFVLSERPGQPRFGLDETDSGRYDTWDDLAWSRLGGAAADLPELLDVGASVPPPTDPGGAFWVTTAADLAAILLRSPVMYARHADDLLPERA